MNSKQRSKLNFIIDVLMFIDMMAIAGIGLLIKFILVPGSKIWEMYGENLDLFLWGWDRHLLGSFHLILGYILLGLLVLHIVFHWKQIKVMFKCLITKKFIRIVLTVLFLMISLLFFLFAFIVDIDKVALKRGEGRHSVEHFHSAQDESSSSSVEQNELHTSEVLHKHRDSNLHSESTIQVNGSMTLKGLEDEYQVSADSVKDFLGIPLGISDYESLGRLRKKYGFHMSDIERFIEQHHREISSTAK